MRRQKATEITESYRSLDGVRIKFKIPTKNKEPYFLQVWTAGVEGEKEYEVKRSDFRKLKEQDFYVFIQECLDDYRKNLS